MAVISTLLIRLSVAHRGVERGFEKTRKAVDNFERGVNQSSAALNRMGRAMTSIGVGPGIVAATGAVTQLAAVAAPAVNTIIALPAALAQFAAAGTVVKLAGAGMGDAISAVAGGADDAREKLAALPPPARAVAQSVGEMQRRLQRAVQPRLFEPWSREFTTLARDQAPMLERGMGQVADSLGRVARQAVVTANTPLVSGVVAQTFRETAASTDALASATPSLIRGLASVVKVGNPLITTFVRSATTAAAAKAEWLASADGVAWLEAKLEQGRSTMQKLIQITTNLGSTLLSILGESRASAGDLLQKIVDLTGKMAAWAKSAEGQKDIAAFMERASTLGGQIVEAFGRVLDVAAKLAEAFNKLPGPVQDSLLTFSAYAIVLGPVITRFASLIAIIMQIGGVLTKGVLAVTRYALAHSAGARSTTAAWISTRAQVLVIWAQLQAQAAVSAARVAAVWVASHVAMAAAATANMARTVAVTVAGWVMMAAQAMLNAVRMAAAWIIAMGPVGIVIALIVALVAIVIANWDTIYETTKRIWDWIWSRAIKPAIDLVVGYVKWWVNNVMSIITFVFSTLPNKLREWFMAGYNAVVDASNKIIDFMRSLPGKVMDALASLRDRAVQFGRDVIQGIINGISQMVGSLVSKARDAATSAMNAIKNAMGIGSPSKITHKYAVWVGQGAVNGLDKMVSPITRSAERMAEAAVDPWKALGRPTAPYPIEAGMRASFTPTTPAQDPDPRRRGDDDGRGPLVSIGTYNAGGQTPDETARALDWKIRTS